jgi:hypothetical protein
MKKLIPILAVVALLLFGFSAWTISQNSTTEPATVTTENVEQDLNLTISDDGRELSYQGVEAETPLETLRRLADIETETFDFGEFVTSINGVAANPETEFWSYTINGEEAQIGSGEYLAQDGDVFLWRVEEFQ